MAGRTDLRVILEHASGDRVLLRMWRQGNDGSVYLQTPAPGEPINAVYAETDDGSIEEVEGAEGPFDGAKISIHSSGQVHWRGGNVIGIIHRGTPLADLHEPLHVGTMFLPHPTRLPEAPGVRAMDVSVGTLAPIDPTRRYTMDVYLCPPSTRTQGHPAEIAAHIRMRPPGTRTQLAFLDAGEFGVWVVFQQAPDAIELGPADE